MCFFDQHRFSCGDWKWGRFRQHCNREHRTGETCGMKLIMSIIPVTVMCKLCEKIESKRRRRQREVDRINGWREASTAMESQESLQEAQSLTERLDREIGVIQSLRERRNRSCTAEVGPEILSIDNPGTLVGFGSTINDVAVATRVSHYPCLPCEPINQAWTQSFTSLPYVLPQRNLIGYEEFYEQAHSETSSRPPRGSSYVSTNNQQRDYECEGTPRRPMVATQCKSLNYGVETKLVNSQRSKIYSTV